MHDPHFFNLIIIRRTLRTVNIRQTPSTVSYLQFQLVPFTLRQILKFWPDSSIISAFISYYINLPKISLWVVFCMTETLVSSWGLDNTERSWVATYAAILSHKVRHSLVVLVTVVKTWKATTVWTGSGVIRNSKWRTKLVYSFSLTWESAWNKYGVGSWKYCGDTWGKIRKYWTIFTRKWNLYSPWICVCKSCWLQTVAKPGEWRGLWDFSVHCKL